MKKITKSLMALALLVLGGVSASADKEVLFKAHDFSTMGGYPFYTHSDFSKTATIADGGLKIVNPEAKTNNGDAELFVADWMIPDKGANYVAKFTMKSTVAGTAELSMDPWGAGATANLAITESEDWVVAQANFNNFPYAGQNNEYGGNTHIIMRVGKLEGTIIIQKIEIYQIVPDAPVASTGQDGWEDNVLGDLSSHTAKDYIIETNEDGDTVAIHNTIGAPVIEDDVIKVTCDETRTPVLKADGTQDTEWWGGLKWNEAAWDAQFWIVLPEEYPVGTKLHVTFDYKADAAGTASTQTHAEPGDYIGGAFSSNINFTTDWQTFEGDLEVPSHDSKKFKSIAFNLNEDVDPNVYYFRNISVQLPHMVSTVALTTGPADWASFSHSEPVSLINAEAGYAVELKGTYVDLIPVTTVPANTAVIIKAKEGLGIIQLPVIEEADAIETNDLKISEGDITGAAGNVYVLANGNKGVGFYKLASDATVPAGKAYLEVADGSREFIGFGGATAVNSVKTVKADGAIYNLAGQRVKNAQKGIFIINGKKIVVK